LDDALNRMVAVFSECLFRVARAVLGGGGERKYPEWSSYVFQAHLTVTPRTTRCHPEPSRPPLADGGEGPAFCFLCFAAATEV